MFPGESACAAGGEGLLFKRKQKIDRRRDKR